MMFLRIGFRGRLQVDRFMARPPSLRCRLRGDLLHASCGALLSPSAKQRIYTAVHLAPKISRKQADLALVGRSVKYQVSGPYACLCTRPFEELL